MNEPLVHVLVINWNGREHLDACFQSLLAGTYPNVRYILVDNASDDDSVRLVRDQFGHDPRVGILVCPENLGWSGGNNVAMERSLEEGADYIFLLNNDTATAPDALEKLVAMAESRPEIGALAPKMVLFDHPEILNSVGLECSIIGASWDKGVGRLDTPRWNNPEPVIGVCGGACFLRAAVLRRTGLLPADFGIYLDDLDLSLRIWNAGFEVWSCPEAVVRHKFSSTLGRGAQARRKYYLNTRNRFRMIQRNFPWARLPRVKLAVLLGEGRAIGRALLDRDAWRVWAHVRAWASGALYLPSALAERRRRRRAGLQTCRFWPMIRTDIMFCPRVVLPERGWYPEREVGPYQLRPMGLRAWEDVAAGGLRLIHTNCYPALGATEVQVSMNGRELAVLSTFGTDEITLEVSAGRLEFTARHIFDADKTGEPADYGGWIAIQPATAPADFHNKKSL